LGAAFYFNINLMTKAQSAEHLKRIELGFMLSQLRKEFNLNPYSQSKLAYINSELILKIEIGTTNYKIDSLQKYLSALGFELLLVKCEPKDS
jgi:hypothetical protein